MSLPFDLTVLPYYKNLTNNKIHSHFVHLLFTKGMFEMMDEGMEMGHSFPSHSLLLIFY